MAAGVTASTQPTRSRLVRLGKLAKLPTPLLLSLQHASVRSCRRVSLHRAQQPLLVNGCIGEH